MSGHKLYGPKGIGVLYVREKKPESEGVAGAARRRARARDAVGDAQCSWNCGLRLGCEISMREMPEESPRLAKLRDKLEQAALSRLTMYS